MYAGAVLPVALGVWLLWVMLGPSNGVALTGLLGALALPAILAVTRMGDSGSLGYLRRTLLFPAVAVFWLCVCGLFAADVRMSFLGLAGQHTGAALWVGLLGTVAVLVAFPRGDDLRWATRAVAVAGAAAGAFAVLDAAGVLSLYRYSSEVSGFMESSSSLGQLAVLGVGAAAAGAIFEKRSSFRAFSIGLLLLSAAGLVLSQSRGAWVAVLVGIASVALLRWVSSRRPGRPGLSAALLVCVVALLLAVAVWASTTSAPGAFDRFADVSNRRTVIWRSAVMQAAGSPLVGSGPEQFSALVDWTTVPGESVEKTTAYDPHNLLLYILVGGGIPALALSLAGAFVLIKRLAETLSAGSTGVGALVAAEIAFGASLMFSWTSPVAAALAAVLLGALLATGGRSIERANHEVAYSGPRVLGLSLRVLVVGVALVSLVAITPAVSAEYAWASAVDSDTVTPELLLSTARATGDPTMYAGAAPDYPPEETIAELSSAACWHVDAAFELNQMEFSALTGGESGAWERVVDSVELGSMADPASGLWYYLAAAEADIAGMSAAVVTYSTKVLDYPLPEEARTWLEDLRTAHGG